MSMDFGLDMLEAITLNEMNGMEGMQIIPFGLLLMKYVSSADFSASSFSVMERPTYHLRMINEDKAKTNLFPGTLPP